ncbi:MAG: CoA ester lyase [Rhodospirillaceae bacterium]
MLLRSMLFIPGDSEKKLAKADEIAADALILDLEDSVSAARKSAGRALTAEFLKARAQAGRKSKLFVRINPLESDAPMHDLAAIMSGAPDGIVLPKATGPAAVQSLAQQIEEHERRAGLKPKTVIVAISGETAAGVLSASEYAKGVSPRLTGLSWGPWDLAADLGAAGNTDDTGAFDFTYKLAQSLTLLAAKAAGVQAIDTPHTDFKDEKKLLAACRDIRRQGWNGKLAIHPAQVAVIHEGFKPSAEEVAHAQQVIEAFESPESGVASLNGVMLDLPHLKQAQRTIDLHKAGQ